MIAYIVAFLLVSIAIQPAEITITTGYAPTIRYNTNKKVWTIPTLEVAKKSLICLDVKGIKCLGINI